MIIFLLLTWVGLSILKQAKTLLAYSTAICLVFTKCCSWVIRCYTAVFGETDLCQDQGSTVKLMTILPLRVWLRLRLDFCCHVYYSYYLSGDVCCVFKAQLAFWASANLTLTPSILRLSKFPSQYWAKAQSFLLIVQFIYSDDNAISLSLDGTNNKT